MLPTSVALSLIGDLQDVILTGSTLVAALCVLALKSLPPVQKPINSSGSKLKLKVGSPHELLHQQHQPTNAGAKGHFNLQQSHSLCTYANERDKCCACPFTRIHHCICCCASTSQQAQTAAGPLSVPMFCTPPAHPPAHPLHRLDTPCTPPAYT